MTEVTICRLSSDLLAWQVLYNNNRQANNDLLIQAKRPCQKGRSKMRTIRVTGKGQFKVHPDMTRITITLQGVYKEYAEALMHSSLDTEELKSTLSVFGILYSDLKTLSFSINTHYESYQDRKGAFQHRFVGYRFNHVLKVEFESDNTKLGEILYALANCKVTPEFRISYTVKDPEAVKNTLLGKAVTDAKEKAAVLAQAAGIALKAIQTIDYSWGRVEFEANPVEDLCMSKKLDSAVPCRYDIEPDDIDVSDTVTVVWEIG